MFEGDDFEALQLQQHDSYDQALSIIISEARRRLDCAEALVGETPLGNEVRLGRFDHHVIQDAHDLLAAKWRLSHGHLQPPLPLNGMHVEAFATQWLEWLKHEVARMGNDRMRDVLMLAYMDPDPEYSAERRLLNGLRDDLVRVARDRGVRLTTARGAME